MYVTFSFASKQCTNLRRTPANHFHEEHSKWVRLLFFLFYLGITIGAIYLCVFLGPFVFFPVAFDVAFVDALCGFILLAIVCLIMVPYVVAFTLALIEDDLLEDIANAIQSVLSCFAYLIYCLLYPIIAWVKWAKSNNLTSQQTLLLPLLFICTVASICLIALFHPLVFTAFSWTALGYGLLCFLPFACSLVFAFLLGREHILLGSYRKGERFRYCPSQPSDPGEPILGSSSALQILEMKQVSSGDSPRRIERRQKALDFAIDHYFARERTASVEGMAQTQKELNTAVSVLFEQGQSLASVTHYAETRTGSRFSLEEKPKMLILLSGIQQIHRQYQEARKAAFLSGDKDQHSSVHTFTHNALFDRNLVRLIFEAEGPSSSQVAYEQVEAMDEKPFDMPFPNSNPVPSAVLRPSFTPPIPVQSRWDEELGSSSSERSSFLMPYYTDL